LEDCFTIAEVQESGAPWRLQLTAAQAAYDERTARADGQPPAPRQPRADPVSPQRLPAGDESVPKAAYTRPNNRHQPPGRVQTRVESRHTLL